MRERLSAPSPGLVRLLAADLPGHHLEGEEGGWARFVADDGEVLWVASRTERRFLGRTEVAIFSTRRPGDGSFVVELRHRGGLRRLGLTAEARSGGELADRLAAAMTADAGLVAAALPLDFTRFVVAGDGRSRSVEVELMGASQVAIALPPVRSYVRLHPDQREALLGALAEAGRLLAALGG